MVTDAGLDSTGHDRDPFGATGEATPGDGGSGAEPDQPDTPDPRKLAQDWITLWQSELSAMAADPEISESWQTVMALWSGTMSALLRGLPREQHASRHDRPRGRAGAADASRAPPVAAAPDPRDAEIERLSRHVAALERRLANLARLVEIQHDGDPAVAPAVHPKRRPRRKPGP